MKPGDKTIIYETDLLDKPEGEAELIKLVDTLRAGEFWRLKFLDDGFICDRIVWNEQIKNGEGA